MLSSIKERTRRINCSPGGNGVSLGARRWSSMRLWCSSRRSRRAGWRQAVLTWAWVFILPQRLHIARSQVSWLSWRHFICHLIVEVFCEPASVSGGDGLSEHCHNCFMIFFKHKAYVICKLFRRVMLLSLSSVLEASMCRCADKHISDKIYNRS